MLYQQRKLKIEEWTEKKPKGKTKLHSAKECVHVRFATWPKTSSFLAIGNGFVTLQKKQSTCFSSSTTDSVHRWVK